MSADLGRGNCVTTDPARMRKVARIMGGSSTKARAAAAELCNNCPVRDACADWRTEAVELAVNRYQRRLWGTWAGKVYRGDREARRPA